MVLNVKFDFSSVCKTLLEEKLIEFKIPHKILGFGEVEILENIPSKTYLDFIQELKKYNISIVESQKSILAQKIKDAIIELVYSDDLEIHVNSSVYLSEKLGNSYGYLSNLFTEVTHTSIENFTIIQKIERTKHLIIKENLSLTEIAYKLNYSSVAHLSSQFKKTTGITPSVFQRIISKRKELIV